MSIETLKRFISEEWNTPIEKFPCFGIGLLLILLAPIWPFFILFEDLPARGELVERSGLIQTLTPAPAKTGRGTDVGLVASTGFFKFRVQFCNSFPSSIVRGEPIVVWLNPAGNEAWQVHQGGQVICSYEDSAHQLSLATSRLPLITALQASVGVGFFLIAFFRWQSRLRSNVVVPPRGVSKPSRRKRRHPWAGR
jgi:hypothetical protein